MPNLPDVVLYSWIIKSIWGLIQVWGVWRFYMLGALFIQIYFLKSHFSKLKNCEHVNTLLESHTGHWRSVPNYTKTPLHIVIFRNTFCCLCCDEVGRNQRRRKWLKKSFSYFNIGVKSCRHYIKTKKRKKNLNKLWTLVNDNISTLNY